VDGVNVVSQRYVAVQDNECNREREINIEIKRDTEIEKNTLSDILIQLSIVFSFSPCMILLDCRVSTSYMSHIARIDP